MTAPMSCPACSAPRTSADRFCGSCGLDLSALNAGAAAPAQPAAATKAVPAKTMMGMMSPMLAGQPLQAPAPPAAAPATAAPAPVLASAGGLKKTMLGMSPFAAAAAGAGGATPVAAPVAPVAAGQAPGRLLTPAAQPEPQPPRSQPPVAAPGEAPPKQTVFGVDDSQFPGLESATSPAIATSSPLSAPSHRTMLGVAPVAAPAVAKSAGQAIDPRTKQTMLGAAPPAGAMQPVQPVQPVPSPQAQPQLAQTPQSIPVPTAPTPTPMSGAPRSFSKPVPAYGQDTSDSLAPPPPSNKGIWIVLAILTVSVIAGGVLLALRLSSGPNLTVRVVRTGLADALEVQVPGSEPGAKVRFSGSEQLLVAGRAQFPLVSDSLNVGDNELAIDVVSKSGDVDGATVALRVDYRVRTDLAPLALAPPAIDVVVDAVPGSRVTLDGQPLALDGRGHAVKRYVVPPQTGATYTLSARYRIEGTSAPVQGDASVSMPVTSMQIDKPGPRLVTDQTTVEIAGGLEPTATVHISGTPVPVNGGRFLHRVSVPNAGEYTFDVIARAPGKAPRQIPIQVRRVEDMSLAAASFEADKTLTYARIAPNPIIYRGQKVAFDGRVYNVEVQNGRSLLQLLVLDCPGAQRCPLWVEVAQATDATVDTWVRVLGTVSGEQQFRSKQGQVQNVPSVTAEYVLKLAR